MIVSLKLKLINIFFNYYLVSSGVPIVPFTPKKLNLKEKGINKSESDINKEKEKEKEEKSNTSNNKKDEKMLPTVFVPTSVIINPIIKPPKNIYNKYQKKKQKPFMERTGDWICKKCKNLNFAFRQECNRCKFPKKEENENPEKKEENNDIKENNNIDDITNNKNYFNYNNGQQFNFRKNKYRFKKYNYY